MKVLNLRCQQHHFFEGWFASEHDFQSQLARGLVECPLCCDKSIQKMPSAPRLNLGGHQAAGAGSENHPRHLVGESADSPETPPRQSTVVDALLDPTAEQSNRSPTEQAAFFKALRQAVANTEDVGDKFADEARAMHYGDAQARSIRGQASAREAQELLREGIDVMPLPPLLRKTLQ